VIVKYDRDAEKAMQALSLNGASDAGRHAHDHAHAHGHPHDHHH
jgi:hypothetical protein